MDKKVLQEAISKIRDIERKISDLDGILSGVSIFNRNELIQEIYQDIILNDKFLQTLEKGPIQAVKAHKERKPEDSFDFDSLNEVVNDPAKKLGKIKSYLEKFSDISENDKNAIIQTLVDKDVDFIKNNIIQLTKVFALKTE